MRTKMWIWAALAACMLGACSPNKENETEGGSEGAVQDLPSSESVTVGRFLQKELAAAASVEETKPAAGLEEQPGEDAEPEAEKGESTGETPAESELFEARSGEDGEQTAVYTQAYSDSGLYLAACAHLYAREDKMYRLEEQLELYIREEELTLAPDPENMEKMLDMMGESFQGMMDEYGEIEGVTTDYKKQDSRFLMTITCEITEETAQGMVDGGFLDIDEAEELLSFEKTCQAMEEQGYTKGE